MSHIKCEPYGCVVSREACASRHRLAREGGRAQRLRIIECFDCEVGAAHEAGQEAGEPVDPPRVTPSGGEWVTRPLPINFKRRTRSSSASRASALGSTESEA